MVFVAKLKRVIATIMPIKQFIHLIHGQLVCQGNVTGESKMVYTERKSAPIYRRLAKQERGYPPPMQFRGHDILRTAAPFTTPVWPKEGTLLTEPLSRSQKWHTGS
jgi:hypothetical protein